MTPPRREWYDFAENQCEFVTFCRRRGSEAEGAVVNDSPVDCQSRDLTEPQRDHDPALQYKYELTDKSEFFNFIG